MIIESWKQLHKVLGTMDESALREAINYEVSTYCREAIVRRMHQRYAKLRATRERDALVKREMLL